MDGENQAQEPEGSNPPEHKTREEHQESAPVTSPPSVSPSPESLPPSEIPLQERKAEKKKENRFKCYGFIVNVLTLIAVAWYACTTYRMWNEMQEQTRIQRKTGINTERAWLGLDADLPIAINMLKMGPVRFEVRSTYRIKNFGHGPAFKIASTGWITTDSDEMEQWAKSSCQETMNYTMGTLRVGSKIPGPPPMGRLAFPGRLSKDPWTRARPAFPISSSFGLSAVLRTKTNLTSRTGLDSACLPLNGFG